MENAKWTLQPTGIRPRGKHFGDHYVSTLKGFAGHHHKTIVLNAEVKALKAYPGGYAGNTSFQENYVTVSKRKS